MWIRRRMQATFSLNLHPSLVIIIVLCYSLQIRGRSRGRVRFAALDTARFVRRQCDVYMVALHPVSIRKSLTSNDNNSI